MNHNDTAMDTLSALRDDVALLQLALLGAQASIDRQTLSCLLRVSDSVKAQVDRLETLLHG